MENKINRKEFIKRAALISGSGFLSSFITRYVISQYRTSKSINIDEETTQNISYADNLICSFEVILGSLENNCKIFIDDYGNIIEGPVKIEDYVFTELGDSTKTMSRDSNKTSQEWINKWRLTFKKKYPSITLDIVNAPELPRIYSTHILRSDETFFFVSYENAKKEITLDKKKIKKFEYLKSEFEKSTLPVELQQLIYFGLVSVESNYDDSRVSPSEAKGIWQIIPILAKEFGLTDKELIDITKSTPKVIAEFEKTYNILKSNENLLKIQKLYNLKDSDIIYPFVITRWIRGLTGVTTAINWFAELIDEKKFQFFTDISNSEYSIYFYFTSLYEKFGKDENWKKHTTDYFPLIVAMRNLFLEKESNNSLSKVDFFENYKYLEPAEYFKKEILKNEYTESRFFFTSLLFGVTISSIFSYKFKINRIDFLKLFLTGSIASFFGSFKFFEPNNSNNNELTVYEDDIEQDLLDINTIFEDIPFSDDFGNQLKELILFPKECEYSISTYPLLRFQQKTMTKKVEELIKNKKITKYENIEKALKNTDFKLIQLKENTLEWRLRSVGINGMNIDKRDNNNDLCYLREETAELLKEIDKRLNEELISSFNFPNGKNYKVRIVITSLIRPVDYNIKIGGASENSSHQYGIAFDIANSGNFIVDIVDIDKKVFYSLPDSNSSHDYIALNVFRALHKVLYELKDEGKAIINLESNHIHVMDCLSFK